VLTFPKSSGYTLEKNVMSAGGKISIQNPDGIDVLKGNILFSKAGKIEARKMRDYTQTGKEDYDVGRENLTSDPALIGVETGHILFDDPSSASDLLIYPINVSGAGLRRKSLPPPLPPTRSESE